MTEQKHTTLVILFSVFLKSCLNGKRVKQNCYNIISDENISKPAPSVTAMMVLLEVALMCTTGRSVYLTPSKI